MSFLNANACVCRFDCQAYEGAGNFLKADLSIECGTPRHEGACVFAGFMMLVRVSSSHAILGDGR